jgi:PqqD family protein of HPr-rel-A system
VSPPADGLTVGTPAPGFRLPRLGGDTVGLDDLLGAGKPLLLAFVDPQCGPCMALLPELGQWHRERPDMSLAVISRGDVAANRAKAQEHGLDAVLLLQAESEVAWSYEAYATPSMVLVQSDGRVGSPLAKGADAIRILVQSTQAVPSADARPRPHPAVSASTIDEDVVVYDSRTGQGHVLNATAAHVWSLLDGERTTAAVGQALAARYSLPVSEAVEDVRELVGDLTRAGLVVA